MTFVEMVMALAIFALVSIILSLVLLAAAQGSRKGIDYIRSEIKARDVMDQIRRHALVAQFQSVTVANESDGQRVRYIDPTPSSGAVTSEFKLSKRKNADGTYYATLYYRPTAGSDTGMLRFSGLHDVIFTLMNSGTLLKFDVSVAAFPFRISGTTPSATELANMKVIKLTDEVLLRNPPAP